MREPVEPSLTEAGHDPKAKGGEAVVATPSPQVTIHQVSSLPVATWRRRALAVRAALPQLAAHPVVIGASAAALTLGARVALEAARRIAATPSAGRPVALTVTAHVVHHVHVFHHGPPPSPVRVVALPPRR